jgi:ankyrin repeat protein
MNDLTQKLDELVDLINSGRETSSVLSSHLSQASMHSGLGWNEIYPELMNVGFPGNILIEQHEYIMKWLMNAVQAGRIEVELQEPIKGPTDLLGQHNRTKYSEDEDGDDSNLVEGNEITHLSSDLSSIPTRGNSQDTDRTSTPHGAADAHLVLQKGPSNWRSLTSKLKYATFSSQQALARAVIRGDVLAVQKLLRTANKIDPNWRYWKNIMSMATDMGHVDLLKVLIYNVNFADRQHMLETCLHKAMAKKNVEATTLLVENQAPFETKHLAFTMTFAPESLIEMMFKGKDGDIDHDGYAHFFLFNAAKYGHENVFQSLVTQYGGINAPVNKTTGFHLACRSGNMKSIQLALELGASPSISDAQDDMPLHALILGSGGDRERIGANLKLLLKNGAALDRRSGKGQTALHLAAKYEHIEAMEALMQMGLDADIQNSEGTKPLHMASSFEWAKRSVEEFLPYYLTRKHELWPSSLPFRDPFEMYDPRLTCEVGREKRSDEAVRLLLRYGASVNARGKENITPLHLASQSGNLDRMKTLIKHGADPHAVDDYGWTPLHFAVLSRSQDALDLIITHDVNPEDSALVAIIGSHKELKNVLDLIEIVNRGGMGSMGGGYLHLHIKERDGTHVIMV